MKKKPEPRQYYDIYDILEYYGWKEINKVFTIDHYNNGYLEYISKDLLENHKEYNTNDENYKNQVQILKDFGECDIHVWW